MNRHHGVVIGIVKSLKDPDGMGRIQVEFPWLQEGKRSGWAPIAVPMAGNNRGMYFMPEIDDEALVAFEHGDFAHPFIVGFLWNGVDPPPETTNKNRIIKTPGGHQLRFEDEGDKRIVVKSNGGLEVRLNDASGSIELHGGGRKITMKDGQVQIT
jgi:uncharacterized protein involved in type VI secretion and phage assembly